MIKGFIVDAFVDNGKHKIRIHTIHGSDPEVIQKWISSFNSKHYTEWQTAWYTCLKDVRSAIMRDYGIGWYNRARHTLSILSLKYPEKIHA